MYSLTVSSSDYPSLNNHSPIENDFKIYFEVSWVTEEDISLMSLCIEDLGGKDISNLISKRDYEKLKYELLDWAHCRGLELGRFRRPCS